MPEPVRKFRVYISSADDVRRERDALSAVIDELNVTLGAPFGIVLEPVRWETHARPGLGRAPALIQEQLGSCDIFVGILWWRADPGTEEEIRRAIGAWEHGGEIRVLLYFSRQGFAADAPEDAAQYLAVMELRRALEQKGLVFTYPSADAFANVVRPHLVGELRALLGNGFGAPAEGRAPGRARVVVAHEVLADLAALDSRLGFVRAATAPDGFEARMHDTQRAVWASAADAALAGYRRLIAEQRITSLRQTLNSTPLRTEFGAPLIQLLADTGADVQAARFFYDQLAEVQRVTEALFSALGEAAEARTPEWGAYAETRIALSIDVLASRSELSHLAALRLLAALGADEDEVRQRLTGFHHLEPRTLVPEEELQARLDANVRRHEELVARKRALLEQGERLLEKERSGFLVLNEELVIRPTDTWNEVVGKARALRGLGRTAEAVAALDRYGQMFSPSDPGAAAYAQVAQAFTLALAELGVRGGVYVYSLGEGSAARAAGLDAGDILIEYNGRTIEGMPEMTEELTRTRQGNFVRVSYLRYDRPSGRFTRGIANVEGGPLGAGFMPV